jgi:hypothetical protein
MNKFLVVATAALITVAGCDTKKKIDNAIDKVSKLLDQYSKLGASLTSTVDAAKMAATNPIAQPLSTMARLPSVPSSATGGVDLTAMTSGKSGTIMADLKMDGVMETVQVLQRDDGTVFESWTGDSGKADGFDDTGLCYLSWQDASKNTWLVVSSCDDTAGVYVCQIGPSTTCSACATDGTCAPCSVGSGAECDFPGYTGM